MEIDFSTVDALIASNDYAAAEEACRVLTEAHPDCYRVFSKLAHALALGGRSAEAISAIRTAIALDPIQPALWWKLGIYCLNEEALSDAISAFSETIRISESYGDPYYRQVAYFLRAEAYARRSEFGAATADLQEVQEDMFLWLDRPISKKAILERCGSL